MLPDQWGGIDVDPGCRLVGFREGQLQGSTDDVQRPPRLAAGALEAHLSNPFGANPTQPVDNPHGLLAGLIQGKNCTEPACARNNLSARGSPASVSAPCDILESRYTKRLIIGISYDSNMKKE